MQNSNLIIGGIFNYNIEQIKPWVLSIEETMPDAHKVMCISNISQETQDWLLQKGFELVEMPRANIPVHVLRFLSIYEYLRLNWANYQYVITTDVKDVIFQKNPFEWLERNSIGRTEKQLVAPSEGMLYKDEPWNRDNLRQAYGDYFYENLGFKNMEICCCGVIAGTAEYVKDLVFNMFSNSTNRPIPVVDQVVFNMLINTQPYKDVTSVAPMSSAWTLQAGTMNDPTKVDTFKPYWMELPPTFNGEKFLTSSGDEFYIVHQYDRVPEWSEFVANKFKQNATLINSPIITSSKTGDILSLGTTSSQPSLIRRYIQRLQKTLRKC
jgi:hypothetical protein